jgi:hypothetical protein
VQQRGHFCSWPRPPERHSRNRSSDHCDKGRAQEDTDTEVNAIERAVVPKVERALSPPVTAQPGVYPPEGKDAIVDYDAPGKAKVGEVGDFPHAVDRNGDFLRLHQNVGGRQTAEGKLYLFVWTSARSMWKKPIG